MTKRKNMMHKYADFVKNNVKNLIVRSGEKKNVYPKTGSEVAFFFVPNMRPHTGYMSKWVDTVYRQGQILNLISGRKPDIEKAGF